MAGVGIGFFYNLVRPHMTTSLRLAGWWRLWILLSAVWLAVVSAFSYAAWPSEGQVPHHPAFIYQLDLKQRELLAAEGTATVGTAVDMPNGYRLQFKQGVEEAALAPVARAYQEITVKAQTEARRSSLKQSALITLLPPIAVAILGVGVAWVRRGFKATSG
jgi:hypothetical protein